MRSAPPPVLVQMTENIRNKLIGASRKMVPPNLAAFDFVTHLWSFSIVYALTKLEIMDQIKAGKHDSGTIARSIHADPDHVYRLMRSATNLDLLRESDDQTFSLTPLGQALCQNSSGSLRDFVLFMGEYGMKFWGVLPEAVRGGKTGIEHLTGKKPFELFTTDHLMLESFNRAMTAVSDFVIEGLLSAYSFHPFGKIVDVGGGQGRLLKGILTQSESSKGILFDLPEVVASASLISSDSTLSSRCEIQGGNFFDSVPGDGDLYVMKAIIHDWDDREASLILRNIRKAIKPSGKLILVEMVVPGPNQKHPAKFLDIEMLIHAGGRERTRSQYEALLNQSGFKLTRVIPMAGPTSIIEACIAHES